MTDDNPSPLSNVADAILSLTYSEMLEIGISLRDMYDDAPRDLTDQNGWADILHSWADSYTDDE